MKILADPFSSHKFQAKLIRFSHLSARMGRSFFVSIWILSLWMCSTRQTPKIAQSFVKVMAKSFVESAVKFSNQVKRLHHFVSFFYFSLFWYFGRIGKNDPNIVTSNNKESIICNILGKQKSIAKFFLFFFACVFFGFHCVFKHINCVFSLLFPF